MKKNLHAFHIPFIKSALRVSCVVFLFACANASRAENIGVPSECEDVMLQAFYWDSYKSESGTVSKYGCTKWNYLINNIDAITTDFDLVWLPPSAMGGGVGYTHKQLSNQDSDWGPRLQLQNLITKLHNGGTKVIADIVINHRGNKSSWCDFYADNFGSYGSFQLTQQHICLYDEGFTKSGSSCYNAPVSERGAADSGTNFDGVRDLDHTSEYVQSWAKAYVQWMLKTMKYDGFRYDMTLGYDGKYLSMYNEAAQPYLSVSELWSDINTQVNHLKAANYNTMIFDFPLKYKIGEAIGGNMGAYGALRNPSNSLRGKGYGKYAVTFIDNHDTFERSDNQGGEFIKYNADLNDSTVRSKILQANAYILMMPGIPCVFYPHWRSYQEDISKLIAIRKRAGIHSESVVSDEVGGQFKYSATVQGHHGKVIVRLGKNRDKTQPEGYETVADYPEYNIYYKAETQGLENIASDTGVRKIIYNGQVYIVREGKTYTLTGSEVREK